MNNHEDQEFGIEACLASTRQLQSDGKYREHLDQNDLA